MKICVTGGAGYIGSHTVLTLLLAGHDVHVIDDLSNSHPRALERVDRLASSHEGEVADVSRGKLAFTRADVRDAEALGAALDGADAVIHFAGLKAVGESWQVPLRYYQVNLDSTLVLLEQMRKHDVSELVFSSSATVYGDQEHFPYVEGMDFRPASPYGRTKVMIEQILMDMCSAHKDLSVVALRYFNPIGAHPSGLIGEDPAGIPNNLFPYICQVASGRREKLTVFGADYPTADGTCERDYIHVLDLAQAHMAALGRPAGFHAYNIGTGERTSVFELIHSFSAAIGVEIPYEIGPRRAGDLPAYWADSSLAERELGWHATHSIADACRDSWAWQSANPSGYAGDFEA